MWSLRVLPSGTDRVRKPPNVGRGRAAMWRDPSDRVRQTGERMSPIFRSERPIEFPFGLLGLIVAGTIRAQRIAYSPASTIRKIADLRSAVRALCRNPTESAKPNAPMQQRKPIPNV